MIHFKGRLDHSIILGSTIRCYYQVGSHQLTVDLLNSEINKRELEKETDLYIHQDHIVAIDG
jgi:putative spermidine/putrescine transport system ATP-binding protein